MHLLVMMRIQPTPALSGDPVPPLDAGRPGVPVAIELSDVSVTFGRGERAVPALATTNLRIGHGEFVALVGPSGCGKSTILRLVAGLVQPSTGVVIVGGREVAAKALRIGMAFQNPTMLPWLTIEQNIMLPLKIVEPYRSQFRKLKRTDFRDKANALLEQVGLERFRPPLPVAALGRHASARQSVPRADPRAAHAAARRTVRRAGPVHPRGTVVDPAAALDAASADRAAGDPRFARGRISRQPHLRDERAARPHSRRPERDASRGRAPSP